MSVKAIVLAGIILLSGSIFTYGQDEADLAHFQSFFSENHPVPLEKALLDYAGKLEQAREIGDGREEALALRDLGLIHLNRVHDYGKAMDLFIRAIAIEDSLAINDQKVLTYTSVARVFEVVGDFDNSANFLEQARRLNQAHMGINTLAMILNSLGKVNAARGRIDEAFANYQQVLRYHTDIDKSFEANAHFNLANLYTMQGNHEAALASHKKALAVARHMRDRYLEALSLNDIGELYALMRN